MPDAERREHGRVDAVGCQRDHRSYLARSSSSRFDSRCTRARLARAGGTPAPALDADRDRAARAEQDRQRDQVRGDLEPVVVGECEHLVAELVDERRLDLLLRLAVVDQALDEDALPLRMRLVLRGDRQGRSARPGT